MSFTPPPLDSLEPTEKSSSAPPPPYNEYYDVERGEMMRQDPATEERMTAAEWDQRSQNFPTRTPRESGAPAVAGPAPTPVTFFSTGRSVGGPDELEDKWTNRGYSATGRNLTEGVAAVNPSVYPLGTLLRDVDSGETFLAADKHGNRDAQVVDLYRDPANYSQTKEARRFEVAGRVDRKDIPDSPEGVRALLNSVGGGGKAESGKRKAEMGEAAPQSNDPRATGFFEWKESADGPTIRRPLMAVQTEEETPPPVAAETFTPPPLDSLDPGQFTPPPVESLEAEQGTVSNLWNSFARGATREGIYMGTEGASRAIAGTLRNDDWVTRTEEGDYKLNLWAALGDSISQTLDQYADDTQSLRRDLAEALPVEPEFAESYVGGIAQGLGQVAGTLPQFAIPGLAVVGGLGSAYQEAYDDALTYEGVSEEQAHNAGMVAMPSGALDYLADKFILGKILKPLKGKVSVGDVVRHVALSSVVEGSTEAAQQVWLNVVAKSLSGYDPERALDDEVIKSMIIGAVVGGTATAVGSTATAVMAPRTPTEAPNGSGARLEDVGATGPTVDPEAERAAFTPPPVESMEPVGGPVPVPAPISPTATESMLERNAGWKPRETRAAFTPSPESQGSDAVATPPPRERRVMTPREITAMNEERAARKAMEEELKTAGSENSYELLEAVEALGGLPARGSRHRAQWSGELDRLTSATRSKVNAEGGGFMGRVFRTDAPPVDRLRAGLEGYGFTFETETDLLDALEGRLSTGRREYASPQAAASAGMDIPFSTTTQPAAVMPPQAQARRGREVQSAVKTARAALRNAPEVVVHEDASTIPEDLLATGGQTLRSVVMAEDARGAGVVDAFYNPGDGKIHLIASRLRDGEHAAEKVRHEALHHALATDAAFRAEYDALMASFAETLPAETYAELRALYGSDPMTLMEEYMARLAESGASPSVWRRFVSRFRRVLARVFPGVKFTEADIRAFLQSRMKRRGPGRMLPGARERGSIGGGGLNRTGKGIDPEARYMELALDPETNELKLEEMVLKAAKAKGFEYSHRRSDGRDPRETGYVVLLAEDRDQNRSYGPKDFVLNAELAQPVAEWMVDWYAAQPEFQDYAELNGIPEDRWNDAARQSMEPIDIVNSADFWDDAALVSRFWEENETRLLDSGTAAIRTPDGAVVFDSYTFPSAIKSADAVTYDDGGNIIPLNERFDPANPDIRFSKSNADEAAASDSPGARRRFTESVKAEASVRPEVKERLTADIYDPVSNEDTVAAARARIAALGLDAAKASIMDQGAGWQPSATEVAMAIELLGELQTRGRYDEAAAITDRLATAATDQGRAIQALSLIGRLTPEGIQAFARRVIGKGVQADPEIARLYGELERLRKELAEKVRMPAATEAIMQLQAELDALLKDKAAQVKANLALREALLQSWDDPAKALPVLEKLLRESGLSPENARRIAQKLVKETKIAGKAGRKKVLDGVAGTKEKALSKRMLAELMARNERGELTDAELLAALGKMMGVPVWTPEMANKARQLARQYQASKDPEVRLIMAARMLDLVRSTTAPSIWTKLRGLQNLAMLLNPKTVIRNIGGNSVMWVGDVAADTITTYALDPMLSVFTGTRTRTTLAMGARVAGLGAPVRDFRKGRAVARAEGEGAGASFASGMRYLIDMSRLTSAGKFEIANVDNALRKTFSGPVMGALEDTLSLVLGAADRAFWSSAYQASLTRQMAAYARNSGGVVPLAPTPAMQRLAMMDASAAIFQNDNWLSTGANAVRKGLNQMTTLGRSSEYGLGTGILPFVQVPGSIALKAADWSPAGFIRVGYEVFRPVFGKREFRQREFADALSRALIGSGTYMLGYWLAKIGIATAMDDDDDEMRDMQRAAGLGAYRVNASALGRVMMSGNWWMPQPRVPGDLIVNYNWITPNGVAVAAGAQLAQAQEAGRMAELKGRAVSTFAQWMSVGAAGGEAFLDQSFLTGLASAAKTTGNSGLVEGGAQMVAELPLNFIPTVLKQVRDLSDNTMRETAGVDFVERIMARAQSSLPGLSMDMPARYDLLGEAEARYQYGTNTLFNVFLNPAFVSRYKSDPVLMEAERIYRATGDKSAVPRNVPPTLNVEGVSARLTNEEVSQYQQAMGTYSKLGLTRIMAAPGFAGAPVAKKADAFAWVLRQAADAAKMEVLTPETPLKAKMREEYQQKAQREQGLMLTP